jgi:hypothetical protein
VDVDCGWEKERRRIPSCAWILELGDRALKKKKGKKEFDCSLRAATVAM